MDIQITLDWWLIPTLIMFVAFFWSNNHDKPKSSRGYLPLMDFAGLYKFAVAIIISLVAWLIWALLN